MQSSQVRVSAEMTFVRFESNQSNRDNRRITSETKETVQEWLKAQPKILCSDEIKELTDCNTKCIQSWATVWNRCGWTAAANILNKPSRTDDKRWCSSLGFGRGANTPHRKKQLVTKYYTETRICAEDRD
jgi:hypothetical protein